MWLLSYTLPQQSTATAWGLPVAVSPLKKARRRRGRRCQQSKGSRLNTLPPRRAGQHSGAVVSRQETNKQGVNHTLHEIFHHFGLSKSQKDQFWKYPFLSRPS